MRLILTLMTLLILIWACGGSDKPSASTEGDLAPDDRYEQIQPDVPPAAINEPIAADPAPINPETTPPVTANQPTTSLSFDVTEHDFGTITEGDKVSYTFTVTNTGENPLIIANCKGSCGCTVPVCPQEPIMPGESGSIPVEYDSKGKSGQDVKTVTVMANTNPPANIITIKAFTENPG